MFIGIAGGIVTSGNLLEVFSTVSMTYLILITFHDTALIQLNLERYGTTPRYDLTW